jgi:hypothetical protein
MGIQPPQILAMYASSTMSGNYPGNLRDLIVTSSIFLVTI